LSIQATELGTITIRYDGMDAERHSIEIGALAESLKGLGRIIGTVGTFAATDKLALHADARPLKVVVGPPEPNCLTFIAAWEWVNQTEVIAGTASGLAGTLITAIFTHFRGRSEEMKHLRAVAEEAIRAAGHRDGKVIERMLDTVDRMAERLAPAVRQAVDPVGTTAQTMTIQDASGANRVVVDKAMRDAIRASGELTLGDERLLIVRFVEMNLENKTCRLRLEGEDEPDSRQLGEITDPEFLLPANAYANAFAAKLTLEVRARPTFRDGEVDRWYISGHR
jgi:hypothetical protein